MVTNPLTTHFFRTELIEVVFPRAGLLLGYSSRAEPVKARSMQTSPSLADTLL